MENVYLQKGDGYIPYDSKDLKVVDALPMGVYSVRRTMFGFQLVRTADFVVPDKMYGNPEKLANRILDTYERRESSTGVIMTGIAGTGKTMTSKFVSKLGAERGIITILIGSEFSGDDFNTFIQSISQPCIVMFDEFEKVYDRYDQQQLLTLFDGVYDTKKLFLLTCNDEKEIDARILNRPGRVYYYLEFNSLDAEFVREYCGDTLVNKDHINNVVRVSGKIKNFSFDMLKAIVDEMNLYNETADDVLRILNIEYKSGE